MKCSHKYHLALLFALVAYLPSVSLCAGESEDAVEVLALSLRCPNKPIEVKIGGENGTYGSWFYHDVNSFLGDKKTLRIKRVRRFGSGEVLERTFSTPFSKLVKSEPASVDAAFKLEDGSRPAIVAVHCRDRYQDDQLTCFWKDADGDEWGFLPITACDAETATNISLAINTLIRTNIPKRPGAAK